MFSWDCDVIVAGAGPVGLSLALGLARRGVRVSLVEKEPALSDEARASTFHPPTLEMFAEWGVIDQVLCRGRRIDRLQFWERSNARLVAELPYELLAADTDYPFRFQCPQHRVTPVLLDALRTHPSARIDFAHPLVDLSQDAGGVRAIIDGPDGRREIAGKYLVGADGAGSVVRSRLGLELVGATYEDRFLLVGGDIDVAARFPGMGPVSYVFDPDEWVIVMHLPDLVRVVFRLAPGEDAGAARAPDAVRARMRRLLGDARTDIRMRSIYRVHRRLADRFREGRVLLCGDAAHINNPTGGMGMNSGIHDAYELTRALSEVLSGGPETLLDAYAEGRRAAAQTSVQVLSDANYRAMTAREPGQRAARNRELEAAAADPVRARELLRRLSMLDQPVGRRAAA